jgi:hypothetical protein
MGFAILVSPEQATQARYSNNSVNNSEGMRKGSEFSEDFHKRRAQDGAQLVRDSRNEVSLALGVEVTLDRRA